jgi:hypothetical protein
MIMELVDHSNMKLGRKAIVTDTRTLRLRKYLTPSLPNPPDSHTWLKGVTGFGEMGNDQLGDCICAACGHSDQVWSMNNGPMNTLPDKTIVGAYENWCGYQPGNPSTDNGGVILDVLNDWHNSDLGGVQLSAFMSATPGALKTIQQAIMLFGFVMIGLDLPITAQTQKVWDYIPSGGANAQPGSWGGHCVIVPAFDGDPRTVHHFTCISWGQPISMTKAFWLEYVDEAYTLLSPAWMSAAGKSPTGFDLQQLLADQALIR